MPGTSNLYLQPAFTKAMTLSFSLDFCCYVGLRSSCRLTTFGSCIYTYQDHVQILAHVVHVHVVHASTSTTSSSSDVCGPAMVVLSTVLIFWIAEGKQWLFDTSGVSVCIFSHCPSCLLNTELAWAAYVGLSWSFKKSFFLFSIPAARLIYFLMATVSLPLFGKYIDLECVTLISDHFMT